jgi:putative transcriptional regulator
MSKIGGKIVKELSDFTAALRDGGKISDKFTCHKIELCLEPQAYSPALVKETRKKIGLSQALFAQFLGVSKKTVSAWEQGENSPNPMACRFMDEIRYNADYWKERFRKSARVKETA